MPKNDPILPEIGNFVHFGPGLAGSFGALLVGRLLVVAPGLYLARHLFTLLELSSHMLFCHPEIDLASNMCIDSMMKG